MLNVTHRAQRVLQVRIDLHLLRELRRFDFDEGGGHGAHVRAGVVERDAPGSDRVFVFVGVDASVDDAFEQVVHDLREGLGRQLAVQGAHEHRLGRVELLVGVLDVVGVTDDPRDHFHLLLLDALRRDLVVVVAVRVARHR